MKARILISLLGLLLLLACGPQKPEPAKTEAAEKAKPAVEEDPRIKKAKERIAQTSDEAKVAVEAVKAATLTINGAKSALSVNDITERFAKNPPNVGIGWEGFKNEDGTCIVWYHFKNSQGDVLTAKWSYDPKTKTVKPVDNMSYQFSYVPN